MRYLLGLIAATAFLLSAASVHSSEGFDDIVTLARAGSSEDVLLAFVAKSPVSYRLTDDEVTLLDDLGVSQNVVDALKNHLIDNGDDNAAPVVETVAGSSDDDADVQTLAVAPASSDQNISYFYSSLAPYGTWIQVDDNWCWRPTAAQTEVKWRPYCHRGHWVYTDQGWAWQSDYSWGWAPFHYGRWDLHAGYGWIWHPDNVWGPAWVHWRNHENNYGWAPLPPRAKFESGVGFSFDGKHVDFGFDFGLSSRDYCFVPGEHFCDSNLLEFRIHHHDFVKFYDHAEVIRTGFEFQNDRILNHGPDYKRIEVITKRDIRPIRIVDAKFRRGDRITRTVATAEGFRVYRPKIAATVTVRPNEIEIQRRTVLQQREQARIEATQRAEQQRAQAAVLERQRKAQAATIEAEHHRAAVEDAKRERERVEEFKKQEVDEQRRAAMDKAAAAQKAREEQAHERQKEAETRAEEHRKAAEETARVNEQRRLEAAKQREQVQQQRREAVNEALKNTQKNYIERQQQNLQELRDGEIVRRRIQRYQNFRHSICADSTYVVSFNVIKRRPADVVTFHPIY